MDTSSSLVLQNNIKNNSEELQDFLKDLNSWEKDIKIVDEKLAGEPREGITEVPPVRCKKKLEISPSKKSSNVKSKEAKSQEKKPSKERIKAYDYAAWDKFDVDKALDSSEEEAASNVTDTAKILSKEERATALKEEGNKCYSSGQLDNAIAKYTQAMALDPNNPILPANRAMAYIKMKKYTAAEADCNKCLKLDPKYIKAYLRRGTSRINLEKLEAAKEDFSKVLELEPWNKEAKKELEKLNQTLSQNSKETTQKVKDAKVQPEPQKPNETNTKKEKQKMEKTSGKQESKTSIKKLKIEEVNSAIQDQTSIDPDAIIPIEKPPHLRSLKPLKRISVQDVPTYEAMRKQNLKIVDKEEKASLSKEEPHKNKREKQSLPKEEPHKTSAKESQKQETSPPITRPKPPRTSHQFSQDWLRLSSQKSQAVNYLKTIPPTFFNNVDLETETFVDVLTALTSEAITPLESTSYLTALAKSSEFSVHVMFFDNDQKEVLRSLLAKCKEEETAGNLKEIEKLLL